MGNVPTYLVPNCLGQIKSQKVIIYFNNHYPCGRDKLLRQIAVTANIERRVDSRWTVGVSVPLL